MRMTFGGSYAGVIGACVGGQFLDGYFIAAAGFIIADLYADPSVSVEVASLVAAAYALGRLSELDCSADWQIILGVGRCF